MLELRGLTKRFDGQLAVDSVSFIVAIGEIVALLGPSGSGKSTLLAIIAGLESADTGQVLWGGEDLADVPAHQRNFGLMFQDFALFPHRDVLGNVAFGLQMHQLPTEAMHPRIDEALRLVGLSGFEHRDVSSLSGGEQQRVALARALAPQPRLLMLDEPLGSLDRALRTRLLADLAAILRKAGQTSLYVTHDQEEAYAIADRIVIMNNGHIEQLGTPQEIYRNPATLFVAHFLGMHNVFPARRVDDALETPLGKIPWGSETPQSEIAILLRPDEIALGDGGPVRIEGALRRAEFRGATQRVVFELASGVQIEFEAPSNAALPGIGSSLAVSFDPAKAIQVFRRE